MIPKSRGGARSRYLDSILDACPAEPVARWPERTKDDLALLGRLISQFSNIDFAYASYGRGARYCWSAAASIPRQKRYPKPAQTRDAILTGAQWTKGNLMAFNQIE